MLSGVCTMGWSSSVCQPRVHRSFLRYIATQTACILSGPQHTARKPTRLTYLSLTRPMKELPQPHVMLFWPRFLLGQQKRLLLKVRGERFAAGLTLLTAT